MHVQNLETTTTTVTTTPATTTTVAVTTTVVTTTRTHSNNKRNINSNSNRREDLYEYKSIDGMEDFPTVLDFGNSGAIGKSGISATQFAAKSHNNRYNGNQFVYGQGMQNKRPRPEMEDDQPLLLPGFEKVWEMVPNRYFEGVKPIRDANRNYMYF